MYSEHAQLRVRYRSEALDVTSRTDNRARRINGTGNTNRDALFLKQALMSHTETGKHRGSG
jgi:hypothetical protein